MALSVLGPVLLDGVTGPVQISGRKAREILTLLALAAPRPRSVTALSSRLWDEPPAAATKTVQGHLSRLRTALASASPPVGAIRGTSAGYRLAAASEQVDVVVIEELRRTARLAALAGEHAQAADCLGRARELWRGEAELPATFGGDLERAALTEQRLMLAEDHTEALIRAGRSPDTIAELDQLVRIHPLRERIWQLLIEALYRTGRQADALEQCRRARAVLLEEVGVDPGPQLRELEHRVRHQSVPDLTGATGAGAPGRTTVFDGPYYAMSGEAHVAYGFVGEEKADPAREEPTQDLLLINPTFIPVDSYLEEAGIARAMGLIARRRRMIAYDRRGVGLSDPATPDDPPSLQEWADNAVAVLDAAGIQRVDVLANADTSLVALLLAAQRPDRVRRLCLVNALARDTRAEDYPFGQTADELAERLASIRRPKPEPTADVLAWRLPAVAADAGFRAWWNAVGRRGASPRSAALIHRVIVEADIRDVLVRVTAPVLLLSRLGCASYDPGHGRYLAEHLPRAVLRERPDANDAWFVGDVDWIARELDRFTR